MTDFERGYKQGYADAMNWKTQNYLEHLPSKQPQETAEKPTDGEAQNPASCINRLDIIRMAHEAGFVAAGHPMNPWSAHTDEIETFAALVAAYEREECAKIAEEWSVGVDDPRYQCDCATAIRRGKQ
jgi:hypothetical protein